MNMTIFFLGLAFGVAAMRCFILTRRMWRIRYCYRKAYAEFDGQKMALIEARQPVLEGTKGTPAEQWVSQLIGSHQNVTGRIVTLMSEADDIANGRRWDKKRVDTYLVEL